MPDDVKIDLSTEVATVDISLSTTVDALIATLGAKPISEVRTIDKLKDYQLQITAQLVPVPAAAAEAAASPEAEPTQ